MTEQRCVVHGAAVEQGAPLALHVLSAESVVGERDLEMHARDMVVVDHDVAGLGAAADEHRRPDLLGQRAPHASGDLAIGRDQEQLGTGPRPIGPFDRDRPGGAADPSAGLDAFAAIDLDGAVGMDLERHWRSVRRFTLLVEANLDAQFWLRSFWHGDLRR